MVKSMKKVKKIIAVALVLTMLFASQVTAFAADTKATKSANKDMSIALMPGVTGDSNTVTFKIKVENCPDFMEDTEDIITAVIGSKLEDVAGQSTILQQMTDDNGYYQYVTDIEGHATTIFTVNGSTNADIAYEGALSTTDIIDETWDDQIYYVIEAH